MAMVTAIGLRLYYAQSHLMSLTQQILSMVIGMQFDDAPGSASSLTRAHPSSLDPTQLITGGLGLGSRLAPQHYYHSPIQLTLAEPPARDTKHFQSAAVTIDARMIENFSLIIRFSKLIFFSSRDHHIYTIRRQSF